MIGIRRVRASALKRRIVSHPSIIAALSKA